MPKSRITLRIRNLRTLAIFVLLGLVGSQAWSQAQASSPNDRARFLAALPVADNSPLKKLEQLPAYGKNVEYLSEKWQEAQKERWDAMAAWGQTEVRPHINPNAPLFYMFGGPDFLNAHILYPEASRYLLCGLEPVGRVTAMETWHEEKITEALSNIGVALKSMLEQGFFFTKDMQSDLARSEASGVLPLLYVTVVRAGNQITDMQYVKLSESGEVQSVAGEDPVKGGARGVKITFIRKSGAPAQELYYFRVDVSDAAQRTDSRFFRFMASQGRGNCYLKAAAYLMHQKEFSQIRNLLLSQSHTILQDDSGIAYRDLDPGKWKIALYGNYQGPVSSIAWAVQPDLKKAYAVPGAVKPISFKTSYRSKAYANLLFAVAKGAKPPQ
jgi:hypothetical protein